ncbi:MAG: class I SAM-dependent methyltransferase [Chlorobiaceae bacterium]|nr:class I SAM-dependent methyltransferase [Chlorobiaceae bacterium]
MELVPCPISGDRDFTPLLEAPDRFAPSAPSWSLVRSSSSGLVMLNPRPEATQASKYYPEQSYDPFLHRGNCRNLRDRAYLYVGSLLLKAKAGIVMKGLHKPAGSVRVLEAGCSTGRLLLRLNRDYEIPLPNLWGIEPDRQAAAVATAAGLRNISGADLAETEFDNRFDRIVFWHVLEHLHRIEEALDKAHDLLEPDGVLVIALPNIDSDDAGRYGAHWIAIDAPRHLYHFTPETLTRLLGKHGFSVLDITAFVPDAIYNVWYSEKLDRTLAGRPFSIRSAARAAARTVSSVMTGIDPRRSSGFVCRAVRSNHDFGSALPTRPSDFSSSAEATR